MIRNQFKCYICSPPRNLAAKAASLFFRTAKTSQKVSVVVGKTETGCHLCWETKSELETGFIFVRAQQSLQMSAYLVYLPRT